MNLLSEAGFPVSLLLSGGGLVTTAFLIHLLHKPANRVRLVDRPGGRKQHEGIIPLTGGLAIYGGFVIVSQASETPIPSVLFLGMTFVLVVGLIDDIYGLSARIRLGTEVAAALIMTFWGGLMIEDLADLVGFGSIRLGFLAIPFTILCTVGFINAFNMADGVDGLASGLAASALVWFIAAAWLADRPAAFTEWLLLSTVIGFMFYNARHPLRKRASAFLGDSGSMLLGFILAWCAIRNAQGPHRTLSPIAVAWVLALPVMDTIRLMVQRGLRGQSPFVADREHMHHILLGLEFTQGETAWLLIGVSAILGGVGVLGHHFGVPDAWLTAGFIGVFFAHCWLIRFVGSRDAMGKENINEVPIQSP
jgi:UDP-GlcNAc:undecaprenyl-phosphate GlcNAc-1-phosphate transferase